MRTSELTTRLIARAFPELVADDPTAMQFLTRDAVDSSRAATLATVDHDDDVWLFGYGSLMWNPEVDFAERRRGLVRGWHRAFCLWQWRFRGSRGQPGLMMALDRGGACVGALFRIPGPGATEKLAQTWRREMPGMAYRPIWINACSPAGPVRAVTFVADRKSHRYAGRLPEPEIARHIARACGQTGPNASYLLETWKHCTAIGIRDPMLDRLQALVAVEITRSRAP